MYSSSKSRKRVFSGGSSDWATMIYADENKEQVSCNTATEELKLKKTSASSSSSSSSSMKSFIFKSKKARINNKTTTKKQALFKSKTTTKLTNISNQKEQCFLDFGQKLPSKSCTQCGMYYTVGQSSDEATHKLYHDRVMNGVSFKGWNNEKVLERFSGDDRIIEIDKTHKNRDVIHQVVDLLNRDLGGTVEDDGQTFKNEERMFLYVCNKRIAGCVIVRYITDGILRLFDVPELNDGKQMKKNNITDNEENEINKKIIKSGVGIEKMWVHTSYRRKGIMSRLLDSIRLHYTYSRILDKDEFIFSQPTTDGKVLAAKYTQEENFLVFAGCI